MKICYNNYFLTLKFDNENTKMCTPIDGRIFMINTAAHLEILC